MTDQISVSQLKKMYLENYTLNETNNQVFMLNRKKDMKKDQSDI